MKNTEAIGLTIGGLAKSAGVGVETIRFYQRRGLLEIPGNSRGYRRYKEAHLERLRFIKRSQSIGFTLEETAELLTLNDMRDHRVARALAQEKLRTIEERIEHLEDMRRALHHLVRTCEHGDSRTPCPIIRLALDTPETGGESSGAALTRS